VLVSSEARGTGGDSWEGGHRVKVTVGGQNLETAVTDGERVKNARNPRWRDIHTVAGTVKLEAPGVVSLAVQPVAIAAARNMGFTLRSVLLVPAR
ncbi:MAG: hypothetical protein ACREB3_11715, partial [Burkholderiales bacterium]